METPSAPFNHGGFWDEYSKRWEQKGDGRFVKKPGSDEILGAEWGEDREAAELIENWLRPHVSSKPRTLEIGPGGGKFSRLLDTFSSELVLVDIAPKMLDRAARACARAPRTIVVDGTSLRPVADERQDLVFSYDVFIHLESEEIFRYFAEVNRVLAPRGHFLVHTSNFESRHGMLSYFRQIRDHVPLIGSRYGGRMYPMSPSILRRFAEHSGFEVIKARGDWSDRNIVFLLKKTHPAWMWRVATSPILREEFELCERIGGTARRTLFSSLHLATQRFEDLLIGQPDDPYLKAAAFAHLPEHPALPHPIGFGAKAGVGYARFRESRGPSLARTLRGEGEELVPPKPTWKLAVEFLDALELAHQSGFVHGEISTESIIVDVERCVLALPGFVKAQEAGLDPNVTLTQDRKAFAEVLNAIPIPEDRSARLHNAASQFAAGQLNGEAWAKMTAEIQTP